MWNKGPEIDRDRYDRYVAEMKAQGRRPNGIWLDAEVLLLFAAFQRVNTLGWQRPKPREVPVAYLRENEFSALKMALAVSTRDADDRVFLVEFLRGTGLRLQEFLNLKWRDIDLESGIVTVRGGKGGKSRSVPLMEDGPPAMARALEATREAFWRAHPENTLSEGRLVSSFVWPYREQWRIHNLLKEAAKRAGLAGIETHPHILRHTFAVDLTLRGTPEAIIQRLMGHASPATTSRYQQVHPTDIMAALRTAATR